MDWVFVIPLQKDDLQKEAPGVYHVQHVFGLDESLDKLKEVRNAVRKKGCSVIVDYFDYLYSFFCDDNLTIPRLQSVFDTGIDPFVHDLEEFIKKSIALEDSTEKQQVVNIIKMVFYVISLFIKKYDELQLKKTENVLDVGRKSKGVKAKSAKLDDPWDWNETKRSIFFVVYSALYCKMNLIWPSKILDDELANTIASSCFKSFEDPEYLKSKPLKQTICQVLAELSAKHNYGLLFVKKTVQMMKQHEAAVSFVSTTVLIMAKDHNCPEIIPKILNEINGYLWEEDFPILSKSAATFITDIAEAEPELFIPYVDELMQNLVIEPYAVRNATLVAFSEIILKWASEEKLSVEEKDSREKMLKSLQNHLRDQHSFVRSKCLQLWTKLASARAIPKFCLMDVLKTAALLIDHNSVIVVKRALQLFCVVIKENPYVGKLKVKDMEMELSKAQMTLKKIHGQRPISTEKEWEHLETDLVLALAKEFAAHETEARAEQSETMPSINEYKVMIANFIREKRYLNAFIVLKQAEAQYPDSEEIRCSAPRDNDTDYYYFALRKIFLQVFEKEGHESISEEYKKQKKVVEYMKESLDFAMFINDVVSPEIEKVLHRSNVTDVLEAIEYFVVAYQFGVSKSREIVKSFLNLVKVKESGVKEAVANAYKTLFLTSVQPTAKHRAAHIALRLIKLVRSLDTEQASCLQELMTEWVKEGELSDDFVQILWEKFAKNEPDEAAPALILLGMMSKAKPSLISSNVSLISNIGFANGSPMLLIEHSCKVLSQLSTTKNEGKFIRYHWSHDIFTKLSDLLVSNFTNTKLEGYVSAALSAVSLIYKLALYPEKVSAQIIKKCYAQLLDKCKDSEPLSYEETLLGRLFYIYSEDRFRYWYYMEKDVVNNLKKLTVATSNRGENWENENSEDELDADDQAAAEDSIVTSIEFICESSITDNQNLNAHLRDSIVAVNKGVYKAKTNHLQLAAATSLAKLMMVSRSFCENHIQLYMTLLEKSSEDTVRSNLIFGIGDLICRFPNVIEPWTPHIYARLRDPSRLVQKNAVTVLCHLINREMIKVRGLMSEVCLSLEDPDPEIRGQVQSLCSSISTKGNALYNIVVDIISRLSDPKRPDPISHDVFSRVMKYILSLIKKDRQNELLFEKFCHRLLDAETERQWEDLAFCIGCLSQNERTLQKLHEILPTLNDRLKCPAVYNAFHTILNTASQSQKPNHKELGTDGLKLLEEILYGTRDSDDKMAHSFVEPKSPPLRTSQTSSLRSTRNKKKTKK